MSAPRLRSVQRWMAAIVAHPAPAAIAVKSTASRRALSRADARRALRPNSQLSAAAQLQVYNGGYTARLVEAMQSDYGAVAHTLGEAAFQHVVAAYVQRHPSRHPNLNQLGHEFPAFLRTRRTLSDRSFVSDLAALELAVSRAFDAPEFTPLDPQALQGIAEADWPHVRFVANPSLHLLVSRYPVDEAFQAFKDSGQLFVPATQRAYTAVFRHDDRVFRQRLERSTFAVLNALTRGVPLARALGRAGNDPRVGVWFQDFARHGLFTAMATRRKARR